MGEVRPLFSVNAVAPTIEDKAKYLEYLAAQLRKGEIEISKAALIVSDTAGNVGVYPFGAPCNAGELVGIIEFAQLKLMMG